MQQLDKLEMSTRNEHGTLWEVTAISFGRFILQFVQLISDIHSFTLKQHVIEQDPSYCCPPKINKGKDLKKNRHTHTTLQYFLVAFHLVTKR